MDGTLLHGTAAPVLLAEALGEPEAIALLEAELAGGTATTVDFARRLHELWGVVPLEVARRGAGRRARAGQRA